MKRMFKKIVSVSLAGAFALTSVAGASAIQYMGDIDGDGNVSSGDALTVLQYVVGLKTDGFNLKLADLDGDEKITSSDALEILKTCVGQVEKVEFNEEEPETPDKPALATKQEIVDFYKKALDDAYKSEKVKITKTETVAITLDSLSAGVFSSLVKSIADGIIKDNSAPKTSEATFESNPKGAEEFLVHNALEVDGVSVATAKETGSGYEISLTLVKEDVDTKTMPKYNGQASLPLNLDSLGLSSLTVSSGGFSYPGTVITVKTDKDGKLLSMKHTMPLGFDATGSLSGYKVSATGHGTYTLDTIFAY